MKWNSGYLLTVILFTTTSCVQPIVNVPVPLAMSECEYGASEPPCQLGMGNKGAGIWTFNGQQGKSVWVNPSAVVQLSIQRFDTGAIVIHRRDPWGLTSVYSGTLQGNTINGVEDWRLPNGATGRSKWYAVIGTAQEQQAQVAQQQQAEQQILAAQQQRQQYQAASPGLGGLGAVLMGLAGAASMSGGDGSGAGDGMSTAAQDAEHRVDRNRANQMLQNEYR